MKILGIETSCDETAAAVIDGQGNKIKVLSNIISSQIKIHAQYGGVVPEVAAREHVLHILPVINEALKKANLTPLPPLLIRGGSERSEWGRGALLDAIAVTKGPGLITSLMTGVETAKALTFAWNIPLVGVNHIEGHIYANFVGEFPISNFQFPILILTVSGGHTLLALMEDHGKYKILGETRDDAAGEAFDKAARLMGLGYPGGPAIAKAALKATPRNPQSAINDIVFPRPMLHKNNFDFSFSGLKTSIFYKLKKDKNWKKRKNQYALEFEQAIVDVLVAKTIKAAEKLCVKTVLLSGGVSANIKLRAEIQAKFKEKLPDINIIMPDLKYTTDNAVMIATAGYYKAKKKDFTPWNKLTVDCNLDL